MSNLNNPELYPGDLNTLMGTFTGPFRVEMCVDEHDDVYFEVIDSKGDALPEDYRNPEAAKERAEELNAK